MLTHNHYFFLSRAVILQILDWKFSVYIFPNYDRCSQITNPEVFCVYICVCMHVHEHSNVFGKLHPHRHGHSPKRLVALLPLRFPSFQACSQSSIILSPTSYLTCFWFMTPKLLKFASTDMPWRLTQPITLHQISETTLHQGLMQNREATPSSPHTPISLHCFLLFSQHRSQQAVLNSTLCVVTILVCCVKCCLFALSTSTGLWHVFRVSWNRFCTFLKDAFSVLIKLSYLSA